MTAAGGRTLVAGVDLSTQACTIVVRDADTGELVRSGRAAHDPATETDVSAWEASFAAASGAAGGLEDVAAVACGGQQHGLVTLDDRGAPVRPALLWHDLRSADAARDLIAEFGGAEAWARATGLVPVASFTVTKLRWLAEHEPDAATRVHTACLPHDWLTWRLSGSRDPSTVVTDRSDVSGTGYWSPETGYREDLMTLAFGRVVGVPGVLGAHAPAGHTPSGAVLGPGAGDNAGSALGLAARTGDVIVSLGTSGVACAVSDVATHDVTGTVAGFCDATGAYLPLVATVNGARVLDSVAGLLGVDHARLAELALTAPPGCDGLTLVPYFEGERTPDRPQSTAALHGMRLSTQTPAHLARAAVEGLLCGLADAIDALSALGVPTRRVLLVGGAARSEAVRRIAPLVLGRPVLVPGEGDHVADGAARQAAWVLSEGVAPPDWSLDEPLRFDGEPDLAVRARYAEARELTLNRLP